MVNNGISWVFRAFKNKYVRCVRQAKIPVIIKWCENQGTGGFIGPGMWSELSPVIPRLSCTRLPQRGFILKLVALMCARKTENVKFNNKTNLQRANITGLKRLQMYNNYTNVKQWKFHFFQGGFSCYGHKSTITSMQRNC